MAEDGGEAAFYNTYFYRGNRLLALVTFEGGLVYGLYQDDFSAPPVSEFSYAGFFVGKRTLSRGSTQTYAGVDFNFESGTVDPMDLSLSISLRESQVVPNRVIAFGELHRPGQEADIISATRADEAAAAQTDTSRMAGGYSGYARSVGDGLQVTAAVDAGGAFHVESVAGCTISGTLSARPLGNLFDATAAMGKACPSEAGSYAGHALRVPSTGQLLVVLTSERRENGTLLVLLRDELATSKAKPPPDSTFGWRQRF